MSVLNICNKTPKKGLVLNDLKLMELVQMYPFLYNPRVPAHKDPDYEEWAWAKIAEQFNKSYTDVKGFCKTDHFTADVLRQRWTQLKPLVINLSKIYDVNVMPAELKAVVEKLATQLADSGAQPPSRVPSAAAKVILDNIEMVSRLPQEERLKLEAEVMELLLSTELSSKSTKKLSSEDMKRLETECEASLFNMGLHETAEDMDESSDEGDTKKEENITAVQPRDEGVTKAAEDKPKTELRAESELRHTPPLLRRRSTWGCDTPPLGTRMSPSKARHTRNSQKASLRQCVVRVKRINFEDYLPLATIKKG